MSPTPEPERRRGRQRGVGGRLSATTRVLLASGVTAVFAGGCDTDKAYNAYEKAFYLGLPKPMTVQADRIYDTWLGSVAAAAAVGVFVWGLIFYAIIRFRKNSDELPRQVRYNLPIEVLYTVVPFVIISVLFYYTAVNENFVNKTEKNPDLIVDIVGFQWNWQFQYPKEKVQVTGSLTEPATMYLPAGKRIRFVESSPDVIHSWFVPAFMFKRDVVPGRQNTFEITIKQKAVNHTYIGRCTEFCGEKHSRMNFHVRVVSPADFDAFLAKLKADPEAAIVGHDHRGAIPTLPEYDRELGVSGSSEGEGTVK
ncbi:MAG: cytochrome c oxidase subunit [Actinomycetota bacterium]|nr:cytochrome c oxidase subunit [Actinomycetota bacterium]